MANKFLSDYLIVGSGNIAYKHCKNIRSIDQRCHITLCKRSNSPYDKNIESMCNEKINKIDDCKPKKSSSIAIIASPASFHIDDAIILHSKGFNLLIEKPLSDNLNKINELMKISLSSRLKILIGYNFRYSKILKKAKEIMQQGILGHITEVKIHVETNFTKWRKHIDPKKSVTASVALGGGVLHELSHEPDYLSYLFGKPSSVLVIDVSNNIFDIDTSVTSIFKYDNNMTVKMHQDIYSKNELRYCIIMGQKMSMHIDLIDNKIQLLSQNNNEVISCSSEEMYIDELRDLHYSISNNTIPLSNVDTALETQNIIESMKQSLLEKSICPIN